MHRKRKPFEPINQSINDDAEENVPVAKSLDLSQMAKKTYGKENAGPSCRSKFDQLMESPLKQSVWFKPLSFWARKVEHIKSPDAVKSGIGIYEYPSEEDSPTVKRPVKKKRQCKKKAKISEDPSYSVPLKIGKSVTALINSKASRSVAHASSPIEPQRKLRFQESCESQLSSITVGETDLKKAESPRKTSPEPYYHLRNVTLRKKIRKSPLKKPPVLLKDSSEKSSSPLQRSPQSVVTSLDSTLQNQLNVSSKESSSAEQSPSHLQRSPQSVATDFDTTYSVIQCQVNDSPELSSSFQQSPLSDASEDLTLQNQLNVSSKESSSAEQSPSHLQRSPQSVATDFDSTYSVIQCQVNDSSELSSSSQQSPRTVPADLSVMSTMAEANSMRADESSAESESSGIHSSSVYQSWNSEDKDLPPTVTRIRGSGMNRIHPYEGQNSTLQEIQILKSMRSPVTPKSEGAHVSETSSEDETPSPCNQENLADPEFKFPSSKSSRPKIIINTADYSRRAFEEPPSRIYDSQVCDDYVGNNTSLFIEGRNHKRARAVMKSIYNGDLTFTFVGDNVEPEMNGKCGRHFRTYVNNLFEQQIGHNLNGSDLNKTFGGATTKAELVQSMLDSDRSRLSIRPSSQFGISMMMRTFQTTLNAVNEEDEDDSADFSETFTIRENSFDMGVPGEDDVLNLCSQSEVLPFEELYNEETLPECIKIGEGSYGEVFKYKSITGGEVVFKVIPLEGKLVYNGQPQISFKDIYAEILITKELSCLRSSTNNRTDGFTELKCVNYVQGRFPMHLKRLWDEFDVAKESYNVDPSIFPADQKYIVFELANGGVDLENFVFKNASELESVFKQTALSLAAAEKELEFEHRDLHMGNILVSRTEEKSVEITLNGKEIRIPTNGVKVSIIDYTLSRISYNQAPIFNDLSLDPTLFTTYGPEYQFEVYRLMKGETRNEWHLHCPKTNIFWLHYILKKMLNGVQSQPKIALRSLKEVRWWEKKALNYSSSFDLAQNLLL